jgi:hypothetical protein
MIDSSTFFSSIEGVVGGTFGSFFFSILPFWCVDVDSYNL